MPVHYSRFNIYEIKYISKTLGDISLKVIKIRTPH